MFDHVDANFELPIAPKRMKFLASGLGDKQACITGIGARIFSSAAELKRALLPQVSTYERAGLVEGTLGPLRQELSGKLSCERPADQRPLKPPCLREACELIRFGDGNLTQAEMVLVKPTVNQLSFGIFPLQEQVEGSGGA